MLYLGKFSTEFFSPKNFLPYELKKISELAQTCLVRRFSDRLVLVLLLRKNDRSAHTTDATSLGPKQRKDEQKKTEFLYISRGWRN